MDNVELEAKVLEIIKEDNYFEMITKAAAFEKEYKTSDFYKKTKKPLAEVIKETKIFYALQLKDLGKYVQSLIDGLSWTNFNQVLEQIGDVFGKENEDIKESLNIFKDLQTH